MLEVGRIDYNLLFTLGIHGRFVYKGKTSTHAERTDPRGGGGPGRGGEGRGALGPSLLNARRRRGITPLLGHWK